ncbi:MAG: transcription antitermination factor NusB [Alphaproteobacteria bacterium]|nr:transcription antitermination factor NusB [Alphaproteobacteria bacterium]MDD9920443.1 transcription antitermination factor NusB [Alphaproteobacteria bacterium]
MADFEDKILCTAVTDDTRSEARLCAIQAIYQWQATEAAITHVLAEFLDGPVKSRKASKKVFEELFNGATSEQERFTGLIKAHLNEKWTFERLDSVMQALLLVATSELSHQPDTPVKVVINEYLTLSRAFFDESQVPFVNGILDKISRQIRPEEFV